MIEIPTSLFQTKTFDVNSLNQLVPSISLLVIYKMNIVSVLFQINKKFF